jgi:hypothetical protein
MPPSTTLGASPNLAGIAAKSAPWWLYEHCTKLKCGCKKFIINELLVEAAGVEPASENVTGQETTCLFAFMPQALPWDVRGPRSERTRNASR